ncbi:hypothetical protein [Modestobacter sp. NPDC049651]|uniref:hypothetical protein n=1 Tax=unclassified Modestobacter TaxID=2643866 RepID=UPI0033FADB99
MDADTSVAARLAALSLDRRGRLTQQALAAAAVRCGLVVDLALADRLRVTDDSIELDDRPTGFAAVDRLLLAMQAEGERPLDSWLDERRVGLPQVVDALLTTGRWHRQRDLLGRARYTVVDPARLERDLALDPSPADDVVLSPADASVTVLGGVAGLLGPDRTSDLKGVAADVPERLLAAAGGAEWALRAAVEHLAAARARHVYSAGVLRSGGGWG